MIGYLTGKIISKKPTQVILDVNGVGYLVNISINTFDKLSDENSIASLFTYLNVKEDALDLFGFISLTEKEMFQLLISVNGIGPKSALSILSGISVEDLKTALISNQISRLVSIPGIGKKTAERMTIELRDKILHISGESVDYHTKINDVRSDAVSALVSLGYNQKIAEKVVSTLYSENNLYTIEELIKLSLSKLNN